MENYNLDVVFNFLKQIEKNNNREWFTANKQMYLDAQADFHKFIDIIGSEIAKFDNSFSYSQSKDYTYRIYRDVRFSKDKSPYKNHFGAYLCNGGRKSEFAGYYLHIQPGASFFGGGVYRPQKNTLKAIRQEIYYSTDDFVKLLSDKDFNKTFPKLMDDKLQRGPKDFPKDCAAIEYIKYKSYVLSHELSEKDILHKSFSTYLIKGFKLLLPVNMYINNAIDMADES